MAKVSIEKYNPDWAKEFKILEKIYKEILKDYDVKIEHVGSTSVEGLAAKPILDIDIVIENKKSLHGIIEELKKIGYNHVGDRGIIGREAFERISNRVPIYHDNSYKFNHNLYVCYSDSVALINHILFRNYLRKDRKILEEYGELKKKLAIKYSNDIDSYCEAKTDFITSVLKKAGIQEEDISDITKQNRI